MFSGSLKISLCAISRLKDTQNLRCEDFQFALALKTEDLGNKPENRRFEFSTVKI